ncbi:MAG: hypothetical protein IT558_01400 [Alphaproteobacteria bacterium]|nr:hypothetical protein [Alphaproteobacteria bacterium]
MQGIKAVFSPEAGLYCGGNDRAEELPADAKVVAEQPTTNSIVLKAGGQYYVAPANSRS